MNDSKWERWSALGGALFVVLTVVSAVLPGSPPKASDSPQKIAAFITDKADEMRWSAFLGGVAVLALFWFAGAVWRFLRRAEGGSPRLTVVAVLGASFAAATATIGALILSVLGITGVRGSGGLQTARFFYIMSFNITGATAFGAAVFVGAFSAVLIRSGALPRALGWIGAIIALVFLASGGVVASTRDVFFDLNFGGFLAFSLWLLVVSIMMFLAKPTSTSAEAPMVASAS